MVSRNPLSFETLIAKRMSRRELLKAGGWLGAAAAGSGVLAGCGMSGTLLSGSRAGGSTLTFAEIAKSASDTCSVPKGYHLEVVTRWGDFLYGRDAAFDAQALTPASQAKRIGYNNDYLAFLPLPSGAGAAERGLLHINHEYTITHLMFSGLRAEDELAGVSITQGRIEQQAQGFGLIEVQREVSGKWRVVSSPLARRVTATTPIRISGPVAGHQRVQTSADPKGTTVLGTFANCAGGVTPWTTVLSCEENVDGYFVHLNKNNSEYRAHKRMRIAEETWFNWHRFDARFDLVSEPREANRFGWVVEYDPYRPQERPVKRTALGRFKHESATCALTPDGRLAVYMGDDEVFQYLYRFVSRDKVNHVHREANDDLLDHGVLSVAQFREDGSLQWIPLVHGKNGLTSENGFHSQADVLIETRYAADVVGATPMDRPEDIEVNPHTGRVYVAMTKNKNRKAGDVNAVNRRAPNLYGYVVELLPPVHASCVDHAAEVYQWDMLLQGGNPAVAADGALYHPEVSEHGWLTNPDNLAMDPSGRLWIATDGQEDFGWNEGLYATDTMGDGRALTRLFFTAPKGAEVTGPCFTPDATTLFVSVQHPGDTKGGSADHPSTQWPDFNGKAPRPSVIAITKEDGGVVGL